MKKTLFKGIAFISYSATLSFLFSALITGTSGCRKPVVDTVNPPATGNNSKLYNELIVWIKPDSSEAQYRAWLESARSKYGEITESRVCTSCDRSLRLLTGRGVEIMIQGPPVSGGRTPLKATNVQGEDGPVYISYNYPIKIDTLLKLDNIFNLPAADSVSYSKKRVVKVAVFDTGVDTVEFRRGYLFTGDRETCIPGARFGWNFADSNRLFHDDHPVKHGTTVARLITEQVNHYKANPVEILPVKTHGRNGASDLFSILCGFAYAQKQDVDIINASFGFYTPRLELIAPYMGSDPKIILLKKYIEHYLTKNKILLIAAAGNKNIENEVKEYNWYGLRIPLENDRRNLDTISFYPASLARDPELPNVIAVTTVDTTAGTASPTQNFSGSVIDIGVQGDRLMIDPEARMVHFVFKNPRDITGTQNLDGSSFATPIATGKISAFYYLYEDYINTAPSINKQEILNALITQRVITNVAVLSNKVRSGQVMKRF